MARNVQTTALTPHDHGHALTQTHTGARRGRYVLERWILGDDGSRTRVGATA